MGPKMLKVGHSNNSHFLTPLKFVEKLAKYLSHIFKCSLVPNLSYTFGEKPQRQLGDSLHFPYTNFMG